MSVFAGSNIASNSSLVFAYDMGNTQKSWKGEPTTNLYTGSIDIAGTVDGFGGGSFLDTNLVSRNPFDTSIVYARKSNSGVATWSVEANLTAGVTYTYSVWCKTIAQSSVALRRNEPGVYLVESKFVNVVVGQWTRVDFTFTVNTGKSGTQVVGINVGDANSGQPNPGIFIYGAQLEQKSYATPFVAGTRSSTQVLLDLIGQNTITATSLTYSSTGTFSFNGSSDFLRPNITHSYLSSSCLEVWFNSTSHGGTQRKTIFGYAHNEGYSNPTIGSIYLEGNNLYATVITASQTYRTASASAAINTNTWYCAVLNKNTATGNLDLYLNGALSGTQTFDPVSYGQWTTTGTFIGSNILDIGKSTNNSVGQGWSTSYFSGSIPITKVYNRVLTAAEIAQNFNATRSRYGL